MLQLTNMCMQTVFTADAAITRTSGPVRAVDEAELDKWGVYDDSAALGAENSNMIARALKMAQQKWVHADGTPSRRFIVLGNRCLQRGIDIRAGNSVIWSMVLTGVLQIANMYHLICRALGTAGQASCHLSPADSCLKDLYTMLASMTSAVQDVKPACSAATVCARTLGHLPAIAT